MSRKLYFSKIIGISTLLIFLSTNCFAQGKKLETKKVITSSKITFIELGSKNCIPCKKMEQVIDAIEKKYGDQIEVVFYDVWTEEQKPYAAKYKIRLIPTQVFLDEKRERISQT